MPPSRRPGLPNPFTRRRKDNRREIRRHAATLRSLGETREEAVSALLRLSGDTYGRQKVVKYLCKNGDTRLQTLKSLFVMAEESPETRDRPLGDSHQVALLLDIILDDPNITKSLMILLSGPVDSVSPVALRYILVHRQSVTPGIYFDPSAYLDPSTREFEEALIRFAVSTFTRSSSHPEAPNGSSPGLHAVHLLEYLARNNLGRCQELPESTYQDLIVALSDAKTKLATLHFIRTMTGAPSGAMTQFVAKTIRDVAHAVLPDASWDVRPAALSALVVMLPIHNYWFRREDCPLLTTVVDILLWKMDWQHTGGDPAR